MTFADLFSGIGGFRLGLERAGMECKWSCEIDRTARAVYRKHWPDSIIYEDITKLHHPEHVDLMCGGFPCQDLSVAGRRAGLSGARSGLFYEFVRLLEQVRPKWFLLENVPGFLSSASGADFGTALAALDECGYGVSWRILDAQYFGLAQRRRRVWIVGHLGGPCPAEILFESKGGGGNSPQSGKTGEDIAGTLGGGSGNRGWQSSPETAGEFLPVARPLTAKADRQADHSQENYIVSAESFAWQSGFSAKPTPKPTLIKSQIHAVSISSTLGSGGGGPNDPNIVGAWIVHENLSGNVAESDTARALRSGASHSYQFVGTETDAAGVRTPTGIPRRLDAPDGPRYKGLGNAVPVPVVTWIGRRIMKAHLGTE